MSCFASSLTLRPSFILCLGLFLGSFAGGCAAQSDPTTASDDAISASKVRLPTDDRCRDVLAPVALALADGSTGLDFANAITVSRISETDTLLYTVSIASGATHWRYTVELDNDSASACLLLSAKLDHDAVLGPDPRSPASVDELGATVPVRVSPGTDDCTSTVSLLAKAAAISSVGASNTLGVDVSLDGADEDRGYTARVDGKPFVVNGTTFANDFTFSFDLSNDSAFKCLVQEVTLR